MAYLIDLSIHLILNSRITLVRNFFVLTSRILSGTCGLEDKYSKVARVSVVTLLSPEPRILLDDLHEKLDGFQHHREERDNRLMTQCV